MNRLVEWIEHRSGVFGAVKRSMDRAIPSRSRWGGIWPSMIGFTFAVQVITGIAMWMYYSPSAQTAWESVYYLEYQVAGGWLLRALHHYVAQVMVALLGLYVVWMIVVGGYRKPREMVFWAAIVTGLVGLALLLTGDLLSWGQNSFWATQVRVKFLTLVPLLGNDLFKLAAGGPSFGHHTLTRFFALHAGVFSGIFLALLLVQRSLLRRAEDLEVADGDGGVPYWPNQAIRHTAGWVIVVLVTGLLVGRHALIGEPSAVSQRQSMGVGLGAPADPADAYAAARPEWAFLGLYELAHIFPGDAMPVLGVSWKFVPIFVVPGVLVFFFLAVPFIGKGRVGHVFNVVTTAVLLMATVWLSMKTLAADRANIGHQEALAAGAEAADRAVELAQAPAGIPPSGALTLMRTDPKTQGPKLFQQHCASCHNYLDAAGKGIRAEEPSAPNLHGFSSEAWIKGLLDPKQVAGPNYFGNTAFKDDEMVHYVRSTLKELLDDEELKETFPKMVRALAAESERKPGEEADEETVFLFEDFGCTDCHKFHGSGDLGSAPDLTGYGSHAWLTGMIGNPAHERFYGDENDRMPAYAESADKPAENILTAEQIEMLVRWLRGEWHEARGK